MVGGGHGLEGRTRQPCGFAHVTRSDVCAFLYRRAAPGIETSNDQVGLTSRTRGNGDGASDPSRVAGAAERAATGNARDVASFDATSFAIAGKALPNSAGRRGTAFGHGQAVAAVANELAIGFGRALRVSTGRPASSARTRASVASSRGAAGRLGCLRLAAPPEPAPAVPPVPVEPPAPVLPPVPLHGPSKFLDTPAAWR